RRPGRARPVHRLARGSGASRVPVPRQRPPAVVGGRAKGRTPPGSGRTAMIAGFRAATRIHAGLGSLAETRDALAQLGAERIIVVADRGLADIGVLETILDAAAVRELVVATALADVNPAPVAVEAAAKLARDVSAQAVLAIG